jgi:hypothetical protein
MDHWDAHYLVKWEHELLKADGKLWFKDDD